MEPVLRNKRGHDGGRLTHCDEEWPPLATTRGSPHTETKTQYSQKKKKDNTKKIKKKKDHKAYLTFKKKKEEDVAHIYNGILLSHKKE